MVRQPKKLTDCPENLRESIDWLIQVKHGNGQDGLKNLADALKKLIGEAITKATTSLEKRRAQLECPSKYRDNDSHCNKKQKEIEQAEKKATETKKSEDESHLEKLKKEKDDHYNEVHYLSEDAREKALKDVTERQASLNTLKESLNKFTDKNSCETLLTNLTEGLEKFLGFNSDSKGYTGEGIVYSDLDRLCDGVMSFLHGVLESVKENPSVSTYDKNTSTIRETASHLSSHLHDGKLGFNDNVTKVKLGIEGYFGDAGTLKKLEEQIEWNILQVMNLNNRKSFEQNLANWYNTVTDGLSAKIEAALHAINMLDEPLKTKIRNDFERIRTEVKHLKKATKKDRDELKAMGQNVDEVMKQLNENVKVYVAKCVDWLDLTLQESTQDIQDKVRRIDSLLTEYFSELGKWIGIAEKILTTALQKIEDILGGVQDGHDKNSATIQSGKQTKITNNATEMKTKADKLHEAYDAAKAAVKAQASQAIGEIKGLEEVYVNKLNEMKKNIDHQVQQATLALGNLGEQVNQGLESLRNTNINTAVEGFVQKLESAEFEKPIEGILGHGYGVYISSLTGLEGDLKQWLHSAASNLSNIKDSYGKSLSSPSDSVKSVLYALESFKKSLYVTSISTSDNISAFTAIGNDIKTQIQEAIKRVKTQPQEFQNVFNTFHREITKGNGDTTVHGKIEKIKTQFDNDFNSDNPRDPQIIQNKVDPDEKNRNALQTAIRECGTTAFDGAERIISGQEIKKNTTFSGLLGGITEELGKIAKIVSTVSDGDDKGAKELLQQLKEDVGKSPLKSKLSKGLTSSLEQLKDKFSKLQSSNVTELEKAVTTLLKSTLPDVVDKCKSSIHKHIHDEVENVKRAVRADTLKRYVSSKKLDLESLNALVEKQRAVISDTIYVDVSTGIKGLLSIMKYWLEKNHTSFRVPTTITTLSTKTYRFIEVILKYVKDDLKKTDKDFNQLEIFNTHIERLASTVNYHSHFSHEVSNRLATLSEKVSNLQPLALPDAGRPVLNALKDGMDKFVEQLQKQYVSRYSLQEWKREDEGKYAKVCLTIMEGLQKDMYDLQNECKSGGKNKWHEKKMCLIEQDKKTQQVPNDLGHWFQNRGFRVPKDKDNQNGELNKERNGEYIFGKITENIAAAHSIPVLKTWKIEKYKIASDRQNNIEISLFDIADFLRDVFRKYYAVCQHEHILSPKAPSNIYHMLQWLAGLRWNHMYDKLSEHFKELFEKPKDKKEKLYKELSDTDLSLVGTSPIDSAGTTTITPKELKGTLEQVCLYSRKVLITFLGHGHADGIYAVDFSCNSDNLMYPTSAASCLDMLEDILNRVFYKLNFLWAQCRNGPKSGGWQECWYGRHIGGSSFQCNDVQCHNQACKLNANQGATQNANQICNQHPICGVKSPLQSFLEDGLSGFLPHSFKTPGCKLECTLSNHRGIPCQTPMGFTDISNVASRTQKGEDLRAELAYFCGTGSNLNKLCSYLSFLLRRPPQTLGDMFAFYHQFLKNWTAINIKLHKHDAFIEAVEKANFGQTYTDLHPTSIQVSKTHSDKHDKGDLFSLTDCYHKTNSGLPCGKYLQPLYLDIRDTFSEKHTANYLSWIVYLTETFYDLLKKLYDDCCSNCNNPGSRCYDKCCSKDCKVKSAYDAENSSETLKNAYHEKQCHSIVKCPNMHPTLHKFGFTFWSANKLSGQDKEARQKRTCKDFCQALKRVIGKNCVLVDLIHDIDKFIWKIRENFSITLLALWSLSLLYLLHIAVVRLDVLRIRSHLKSPASHRIAAQSLLAAARVTKLGKLTYLQP
ncbi:hypothetical protein, conserved [Babesia ovata]|uniref:C3H1-type domain-containing protein n=1 Tax=Babesia ovata TaxID=189622 RepID=A0A2H6K7V0_9APIC|nr:uncharacterized protein BOVATA_005220 [Babesia ovata]GBE59029.1 hypothetical protein, conserved [Babesia ovata]